MPKKIVVKKALLWREDGHVMVLNVKKVESMDFNMSRILVQGEVDEIIKDVGIYGVKYLVDALTNGEDPLSSKTLQDASLASSMDRKLTVKKRKAKNG